MNYILREICKKTHCPSIGTLALLPFITILDCLALSNDSFVGLTIFHTFLVNIK